MLGVPGLVVVDQQVRHDSASPCSRGSPVGKETKNLVTPEDALTAGELQSRQTAGPLPSADQVTADGRIRSSRHITNRHVLRLGDCHGTYIAVPPRRESRAMIAPDRAGRRYVRR